MDRIAVHAAGGHAAVGHHKARRTGPAQIEVKSESPHARRGDLAVIDLARKCRTAGGDEAHRVRAVAAGRDRRGCRRIAGIDFEIANAIAAARIELEGCRIVAGGARLDIDQHRACGAVAAAKHRE